MHQMQMKIQLVLYQYGIEANYMQPEMLCPAALLTLHPSPAVVPTGLPKLTLYRSLFVEPTGLPRPFFSYIHPHNAFVKHAH